MVRLTKRLPPIRESTLSSDLRLSFFGRDVYVKSWLGSLYVVVKGYCPKRCSFKADKYVFQCGSYEECVHLFRDLSMEVMSNV